MWAAMCGEGQGGGGGGRPWMSSKRISGYQGLPGESRKADCSPGFQLPEEP